MTDIIIWGTGVLADNYMKYYHKRMNDKFNIVCFIDNNIERQSVIFWGYEVKSFFEAIKSSHEYIVIFNSFYKEIMEQIGKTSYSLGNVLSINAFFQLYMDGSSWSEKNVYFLGDRMQYELMEYRARFAFNTIRYFDSENNGEIPINDADAIFLCPPILISEHEVREYENRIIKKYKLCQKEELVYHYDEWHYYIECDRSIGSGKKNKDKCFYIIGVADPMQGWGNLLLSVMGGITYAKANNMIPIVDMQNMRNQYLPNILLGEKNSWEDFFEQVSEYSLDEVYASKNVILNGIYAHIDCKMNWNDISLKKDVKKYMDNMYLKYFNNDQKVLGVIYRGTDYHKAYNHPSPCAIQEYIQKVDMIKKQLGYKYIFIATEVEEVIQYFKDEFKEEVLYTNQKRYSESERRWLFTIHFDRPNDEYQKGIEYLTVLYLLSKCNSLVGPNTGTFRAAIVMNNNQYEKVEIV